MTKTLISRTPKKNLELSRQIRDGQVGVKKNRAKVAKFVWGPELFKQVSNLHFRDAAQKENPSDTSITWLEIPSPLK